MPDISVIITTYNRKDLLVEVLESVVASQQLSPGQAEVIVVDNNSTDGTDAAVEAFVRRTGEQAPLEVRYVVERQQGLSPARNRGIAEARGEFILFMDDDQFIDPLYIATIKPAFAETGADCMGGDIYFYNIDHDKLPRAVSMKLAAAERFFGPVPRQLEKGVDYFTGGNMVVPRQVLSRIGLFDPNLGIIGTYQWGGEEYDLQDRIHNDGGTIWSHPQMVMKHHCPPERTGLAYYRGRALKEGRATYTGSREDWDRGRRFLGAPAFLWPQLVRDAGRYVGSLFSFDAAAIFQREYILRTRLGIILEARRSGAAASRSAPASSEDLST